MLSHVDWIKAALDRDPTKTRAGIAEALGVDKSAVTRLLSGERQLKFHEAEKISAYLGAPGPLSLSDRERIYGDGEARDNAETRPAEVAPIFAATLDEGGRWSIARDEEPIDWRLRAPHFANASKVFGFYAPDDAMAPRFMAGEIVWVDPARPATPGDDALFIERRRGKGPECVVLASLTATAASTLEGHQYRDNNAVRLDARRWSAFHVLARY